MFLSGNLFFRYKKEMKFILLLFLWNHAVINFYLHSLSFTFAFYLLFTVR